MLRFSVLALALLTAACGGREAATPQFIETGNPALLSAWGMMRSDGRSLVLGDGVVPYDLNTPLFSDYAHKQRTIWMPEGVSATYRENDVLDFPVGTVITKTFYYPRTGTPDEVRSTLETAPGWRPDGLDLAGIRLVGTRILVHREGGWVALPYVWNADQTDAELRRAGEIIRLTATDADSREQDFAYAVPNANQCAGCHAVNNTTRQIQPIGPAPRHINRDYAYASGAQNQLEHLHAAGYLGDGPGAETAPRAVNYLDAAEPLDARARDYLDINCAHCHNPSGPADTSGLHLQHDAPTGPNLGLCKLPIAAGGGTGGRRFGIMPGEPEESILLYRMETNDPGAMMPELGRAIRHEEGIALIRQWISELDADCQARG